jgi:hypothetical protein
MPNSENIQVKDAVTAGLITNPNSTETLGAGGMYVVECVGADGKVKWADTFHNLVMNSGVQDMNTQYFKGSVYTAAMFLGLITGPGSGTTFTAGDTLALHTGWTENTAYAGSRKAVTFGTATTANPSVISNSASPSSFAMNATATIAGAFLCTVASGTTGVLFSAGDFTAGDKSVASGDTLNVTYTFSLTAT